MTNIDYTDTKDYSDKLECYNACPECGKKNLGFGTTLDLAHYFKTKEMLYISSITCLHCLFRCTAHDREVKGTKLSVHELNRRRWNALKAKKMGLEK